jgi:hypothetical protein
MVIPKSLSKCHSALTPLIQKHFCYAAGAEMMMNQFKAHTGHQRIRGMGKAKTLLRCA